MLSTEGTDHLTLIIVHTPSVGCARQLVEPSCLIFDSAKGENFWTSNMFKAHILFIFTL